MRVVVEDPGPGRGDSAGLEAQAGPVEARERRRGLGEWNAGRPGGGERGEGVQNVVLAGDVQLDGYVANVKARAARSQLELLRAEGALADDRARLRRELVEGGDQVGLGL